MNTIVIPRQTRKVCTAWTPDNDPAARAYAPRIAPKWIAADGKSFWLVWADLEGILTFAHDEPLMTAALEKADSPEKRAAVQSDFIQRYMPRYACNAQRVDLILDYGTNSCSNGTR
jgi:hypothetical protein